MKRPLTFIISAIMILFVSCNKEIQIAKKSKLSSNPDYTSMFNHLIGSGLHKNSYDILVFNDDLSFREAIDLLASKSEEITSKDSTLSEDDILTNFANDLEFESLYITISNEIKRLESENNLFENNDPDNHFIVSDYLRSFLSPYGEVIVGDLLFVLREEYTLGIKNYDNSTISAIRNLIQTNADESEFFFLCNSSPNIFIVSPDTVELNSDFKINLNDTNCLHFAFENFTSCEKYRNVIYHWDFGDGTYSNLESPTHIYSTDGEYIVKLTSSLNGVDVVSQKKVKAGKSIPMVDFNFTHNNQGVYHFTITSSTPNDSPSYYVVDFGDGTDTTIYSTNTKINLKHKYKSLYFNTNVNVIVNLYTSNGLNIFERKAITVKYKNCKKNCSAHSGTSDLPHYNLFGKYYVKTSIEAINIGILNLHNFHSKSIFLRKKNNGSYDWVKADELTSGYVGNYYTESFLQPDNTCGDSHYTNLGGMKKNVKVVNFHIPYLDIPFPSFSVDYHSMSAYLYVKKRD